MAFPNLDLNLLPCFHAVAECGSISKASNELHLTQPAISLQIKKLEKEIKGQLFDRHNRGLVLTPLGMKLLLYTKQMLQSVQKIEELNSSFSSDPSGTINVGSYTTATSYLLPPVLKSFFKKNPKISINYSYGVTESILEMVANYELDCAILSEVPNDPKLDIFSFFEDELIFVTSTKNYRGKKKILPREICDFDYLSYPLRYDYCYRLVEQTYGNHLKKCNTPIETISFDTLKQSLLQGIGASFIPQYMIKDELRSKKLLKIDIGNKKIPIKFSFVTKKDALLNGALFAFKNHIKKNFQLK